MKTIAERLEQLQQHTGGIRIPIAPEMNFGPSMFEKTAISAAPLYQTRMFHELLFAYHLSVRQDGRFDDEISAALKLLEDAIAQTGTFTLQDTEQAERLLQKTASEAKSYQVILAAHAHIDMNWLWGWHETVASTLDTFRTMLTLMEEYPDFTFSQSQASVYKIVEEFDPEMMKRIKQRIAEGRWEVTASTWVENDENMPSERSYIAHHYYTKKYLTSTYGVKAENLCIDFAPDTFGHTANIGELLQNGEVKYMYHCRGSKQRNILYKYISPSGAETLHYCEPFWYNSAIDPYRIGAALPAISAQNGGLKTGLIVYGVGDHGGGPTRRDIEYAKAMMSWPVFPQIKFGTLGEYFNQAESVRDKVPVVTEELNHLFTGCYTSQSRVKQAHKKTEAALVAAEAINAFANKTCGAPYYHNRFEKAWHNVLFTHFHDILTGSCIADSREHAMGLLDDAIAIANTAFAGSMRAIAEKIDTTAYDVLPKGNQAMSQAEGAGVAYSAGTTFLVNTRSPLYSVSTPSAAGGLTRVFHVFNMTPYAREESCELTIWDWGFDLSRVCMLNADMQEIDFQLIDNQPLRYWDHMYFRILVPVRVPAYGYTTVVLTQKMPDILPIHLNNIDLQVESPFEDYVLENDHIRAKFDRKSLMLRSLIDKKTGKDTICGGMAGLYLNMAETGTSDAWKIGRFAASIPVSDCVRAQLICGKLRTILKADYIVGQSEINVEYSLDANDNGLKCRFLLNWREITPPGDKIPLLSFTVPHKAETFLHDTAGAVLEKSGMEMDIPCLSFTAAVNDGRALALSCDSRYGYRNTADGISVSLIHTQNNPDLYPEVGVQTVNVKLFVEDADIDKIKAGAAKLQNPLTFVSGGIHPGSLPNTDGFVTVSGKVFIHSIRQSEQDGWIISLSNPHTSEQTAALTLPSAIQSASVVNSLEHQTSTLAPNGNTVSVTIEAQKMTGIKIVL